MPRCSPRWRKSGGLWWWDQQVGRTDPRSARYVKRQLDIKLGFVDYATVQFLSALHGTGVGDLIKSVDKAWQGASKNLSTPELTRLLETATTRHPPPLVRGRRIKLRYAHQGGSNPPRIVIHGNQTDDVPDAYRRYLARFFRQHLKLHGTPVSVEFRTGDNPYKGARTRSRQGRYAAKALTQACKTLNCTRDIQPGYRHY